MHPAAVARAAADAGLHGFAVTDHNAADNVAAAGRAARAVGCVAVPGMEITSEEEVHVVALLPDTAAAGVLHARVAAALPGHAAPDVFGDQVIANEQAEVLGFNESLLSGATTWSLDRTVHEIHRAGGLAVAAHADRERFGVIGQLGFVPVGLRFDAIEVSANTTFDEGRRRFERVLGVPVVTGSDAHQPAAVGRAVTFMHLARIDATEIGHALRGEHGRAVLGGGRPMEDLALHILDVTHNSIEAGASRIEIDVDEDPVADRLTIRIRDDGRGMDGETVSRATDPFFTTRTTRRVGMGLPLLKHAADAAGGHMVVRSAAGAGTDVVATFQWSHIDRAPLGDLETTVLVLLVSHPDVDVVFSHQYGAQDYTVSSADVREALDGLPLTGPEGIALVREAVRSGETGLRPGGGSA
jgi:hypothetical protein